MPKDRLSLARCGFFPAVVVAVLLPAFAAVTQAEVKHFGVSDVTQFSFCADNVLHRHVILAPDLPLKQVVSLCSNQSADEFLASLSAKMVAVREDIPSQNGEVNAPSSQPINRCYIPA
jgi:hypothetical protein